MKRVLLWMMAIFLLIALVILVADAFKKAHALEVQSALDPWQVLREADKRLNNPDPAKNIRARVERGAQLLTKGEGWEGQARKELAAVAVDADAIIAMLNPLIEKQSPPYPPPVLALAYHMRAYTMLMKFVVTLRTLKSGGAVEGREDHELLSDINDIISVYTKAVNAYAAPESIRKFTLEWVRDIAIPDIQKALPALQQAQKQEQQRQQGSQNADPKSEQEIMKAILGDKLGQPKAKDFNVVPSPSKENQRGDKYSPGEKKLR